MTYDESHIIIILKPCKPCKPCKTIYTYIHTYTHIHTHTHTLSHTYIYILRVNVRANNIVYIIKVKTYIIFGQNIFCK